MFVMTFIIRILIILVFAIVGFIIGRQIGFLLQYVFKLGKYKGGRKIEDK